MAKPGLQMLADTIIPASKLPPRSARPGIEASEPRGRDWLSHLGRAKPTSNTHIAKRSNVP